MSRLFGRIRVAIINRGIIFCQVDNKMQIGQLESLITEGNQKWVGAAPNFVENPRVINIKDMGWLIKNSLLCMMGVDEIKIKEEPRAWAKKYFVALSVSWLVLDEVIRGIKDIIFSSRAAQRIIMFLEEHAMSVLITILDLNRKMNGMFECIRQRKESNFSGLKLEVLPHSRVLLRMLSPMILHFIHEVARQLRLE